jgi:2,3-dihydroxybiphenyl 1,2-dioxygenase
MGVAALGYVTLNVSDLSAWLTIATKVFGMQPTERPDGAVDLRLDEFHHRFTLYPTGEDSLRSVGWEVASEEELLELVDDLRARGFEVTELDAATRADRKVRLAYRFFEPLLKAETELFYGPLAHNLAFAPTRGIAGYKTKGMGLGHIVFHTADMAKATEFYRDVLGFGVADYIAWDGIDATFFYCNPRHHSLAIMNEFADIKGGTLNHIMIEALSFDDVGYAYDIVRDLNVPLFMDMGKHSNDHMQSFYIRTPSRFCMEYGFGGRLIDENWEIRSYDQPMLFGHRMVG